MDTGDKISSPRNKLALKPEHESVLKSYEKPTWIQQHLTTMVLVMIIALMVDAAYSDGA